MPALCQRTLLDAPLAVPTNHPPAPENLSESGGGGTKRFRPVPTLGALVHHLEMVAQPLCETA